MTSGDDSDDQMDSVDEEGEEEGVGGEEEEEEGADDDDEEDEEEEEEDEEDEDSGDEGDEDSEGYNSSDSDKFPERFKSDSEDEKSRYDVTNCARNLFRILKKIDSPSGSTFACGGDFPKVLPRKYRIDC